MHKKVLTEQALYYGDVAMPKDWDIDRDKLSGDILQSQNAADTHRWEYSWNEAGQSWDLVDHKA